jgi:hypothetical protein
MRTRAILACLALGLSVTACGGGDNKNGDDDAVAAVARAVVLDKDKACDLLTQAALEEYSGERGTKAKPACHQQLKTNVFPKSADITVLSVSGNEASVGYTTSEELTGAMKLKKVAGQWRLDKVATIPGS